MICSSCDLAIPDDALICARCDRPDLAAAPGAPVVSHHALARTVRRLKGLVLLSVLFGIVVAPFAFYIASKALHQYRQTGSSDPAIGRQLVLLRRVALGLLIFWAAVLGSRLAIIHALWTAA